MLNLELVKWAVDAAKAIGRGIKRWAPQLLCAAICVGIAWASYLWGKYDSDTRWIEATNASITDFNTKVSRLEENSEKAAKELKTENTVLRQRLADIATDAPTIYVHDAKGQEVRCSASPGSTVTTPIQAFLGQSFKDAWNKLNAQTEE